MSQINVFLNIYTITFQKWVASTENLEFQKNIFKPTGTRVFVLVSLPATLKLLNKHSLKENT